jgi:linoleate 10R-lipoxygenase
MEKTPGKEVTPSGLGNQCSAEFNLAYRWHSAISAHDETWIENIYEKLFGKKADEVSMPDLLSGLGKWSTELPKDPSKRTFGNLERQEDGKFNDDELVNIMTESIEDVAGTKSIFLMLFLSRV